jgi:hypothetical protein
VIGHKRQKWEQAGRWESHRNPLSCLSRIRLRRLRMRETLALEMPISTAMCSWVRCSRHRLWQGRFGLAMNEFSGAVAQTIRPFRKELSGDGRSDQAAEPSE